MQSKANIYFFGIRNDHDRQAKGLWRILILLWHLAFLLHISLHGYQKYKISTWKKRNFSGYIKENVRYFLILFILKLSTSEVDVHTVQLCTWRLTPKALGNVPDWQVYTSRNVWKYAFYMRKTWNIAIPQKDWRQSKIGKKSNDARIIREIGRDLTQSCDKNPYTHRTIQKATWQHKNATKTLITQLLRTDLGRSVVVTAVTQLVWLNRFTSAQPSH